MKENPLGVGIGNQMLYSVDSGLYQKFGAPMPVQWQPIHNIYLLIASEVGILGLLAFLALLFRSVKDKLKSENKLELTTVCALLLSLLVFGLVDHFTWDLQAGRLIFWLVVGLLLGLGKEKIVFKS